MPFRNLISLNIFLTLDKFTRALCIKCQPTENVKLTIAEVFDSINILINLLNLVIFIGVIILFFWFVISKQFDNIIYDKTDIIISAARNDENFKAYLKNYLETDYIKNKLPLLAKQQFGNRTEYNVMLLERELLPFVWSLLTMIGLDVIYMAFKRIKFTYIDYFLLLSVILGFITEILFYYIVIREWKFIGDYTLLILLAS